MSQALPTTFLDRIATYPEPVRHSLQSDLTAPVIRDYMLILHGQSDVEETKVDGLLATGMVVDAFLSRLLRSKRFWTRLGRLPRQFQNGIPPENRTLVLDFIDPLADPDRPFLYKLREMQSETEMLSEDQAQDLALLMTLLDTHTRLSGLPADPQRILEAELLLAASGETAPLLPCLMGALDAPTSFRGAAPLPAGLPLAAGIAFLQAELAEKGVGALDPLDQRSLALIGRDRQNAMGEIMLYPPQPLRVVLSGTPAAAAQEFWEDMAERGLVTARPETRETAEPEATAPAETVLTLPADLPVSPLLLGYLRCAAPADSPVALELTLSRSTDTSSWASRIEGYTDVAMTDVAGQVRRGPQKAPAQPDSLELARISQQARPQQAVVSAGVRPEDAFAILLRLDPIAEVEPYLNTDHCLIVEGRAALLERFAEAGPALLQKPVVCIGRRTPLQEDYLIASVQNYWGRGGRYPVTPVALSYNGESSTFSIDPKPGEGLTLMALADLVTLPLALALKLDQPGAPRAIAGLLLWPEGLIVRGGAGTALAPDLLVGLERSVNTMPLTETDHEAAFLTGQIDERFFARRSTIADWPVAPLIGAIVQRSRNLETQLAKFAASPSPRQAGLVMAALERAGDTPHLTTAIDAFARSASGQPQLLLRMEEGSLRAFLGLARQVASCDEIAARLAVCAGDIARASHHHIVPLFELLASCLPLPVVHAALAFAAADTEQTKRAQYRFGECIRRYGSVELMTQHLAHLARTGSDLLQDVGFLRFFQKLLYSDVLPTVRALVGEPVLQAIAGTLDFKDSFKNALVEGDRDRLLAMIRDPDRTRNVEFIPWMDSLRSHSNELHDMALPITGAALPQLSGVYGNKLMGALFSDRAVLEELREARLLEDDTDLDVICKNVLGDNGPLNAMLARRFEGSGTAPLRIEGRSAAEVFAHAATACAGSAQHRDGPKVSVIISAYNADIPLLKLSLASVLEQSHGNIEVFVVDDASEPENSAEIRAAVEGDPRVSYLRMPVNSGPYMGRNRAIAAASGAFVAIQDADDWSHPHRFAAQIAAFAQSPVTQMVTTPHIRIDRHGRIQMEAEFTILGDGPMTSMFRREVFDAVGLFAQVRSRGDVEMRERLRAYYGNHALTELALPMMLCFADSATLSQKTKSEKMEYLQLFRTNISGRRSLRNLRRDGQALAPEHAIAVPLALRPTQGV